MARRPESFVGPSRLFMTCCSLAVRPQSEPAAPGAVSVTVGDNRTTASFYTDIQQTVANGS